MPSLARQGRADPFAHLVGSGCELDPSNAAQKRALMVDVEPTPLADGEMLANLGVEVGRKLGIDEFVESLTDRGAGHCETVRS